MHKKEKTLIHQGFPCNGVPERIRTSDLQFRKPLLYPAELRGHFTFTSIIVKSLDFGNRGPGDYARSSFVYLSFDHGSSCVRSSTAPVIASMYVLIPFSLYTR